MTALRTLQRGMLDWICDVKTAQIPAVKNNAGLRVYHTAYRARLREALGEVFEKTWAWLGDDDFDSCAATFIAAHPPTSWSLSHYGAAFPAFLAGAYQRDPEAAELAKLDWALHQCFSGPDALPLILKNWAAIDWENAVLKLVPTYREIDMATNAAAIWRALDDDEAPPAAIFFPEKVRHRVWRKGFSPHFSAMGEAEREALRLVSQGLSFGDICAAIAKDGEPDDNAAAIGDFLRQWIEDEIIASVE